MAKKMTKEEFRLHLTLMGATFEEVHGVVSNSDVIRIHKWHFKLEYPDTETGFYYLWSPFKRKKGVYTKHKVPNFDVALAVIKRDLDRWFNNV